MSKYIKLGDAIYVDCILINEIECEDCPFCAIERSECRMFEWLESLPTIEVSEDCISREWLKGHIEEVSYKNEWHMTETDEFVSWENIENAPSVAIERKRGEWIVNEPPLTGYGTIYICPYCKYEVEFEPTNYCPNCEPNDRERGFIDGVSYCKHLVRFYAKEQGYEQISLDDYMGDCQWQ